MKFNFGSKQKIVKNINNSDLAFSLKESIKRNNDALEYILEHKRVVTDLYKYREFESDKLDLQNIEYIEFILKYIGEQYSGNLERIV